MTFSKPFYLLATLCAIGIQSLQAAHPQQVIRIDAETRWATFDEEGDSFFALSLQADPTGDYPLSESFEVVVLMDTSATQTGPVRIESIEALEGLIETLPANAKVSLLACDVDTVVLTEQPVAQDSSELQSALAQLKKRIPLGTTDLGKAFTVAAEQFQNDASQKTVVYIGDGVNRSHFMSDAEHRALIDNLVEGRVTVSSLAIGPVVDVATLAAIANNTGGVLYSRNEIEESPQTIGRQLALSATAPVVWISEAQVPAAMAGHFPQDFPPIRIDRDSIVIGKSLAKAESGKIRLQGQTAGGIVEIVANTKPEASNPDMGFLAAVTEAASKDGGLTLPALGSPGLRALSFSLADNSESLVKSGRFALQSGEVESAIRIAEEALKNDPNNAEAIGLLNAAKKEAKRAIPTGKFTQFGDNPFADPQDDPAPAAGGIVDPIPSAPAPVTPAPQPQPAPQTQGSLFGSQSVGGLLAEEEARRKAVAEGLQKNVRAQLREAELGLRTDPVGVKNSLKLLLEELDTVVEVDASVRSQLRNQVGQAIQRASLAEGRFLDDMQRAETIRSRADQARRFLAETNRRDESLKQLVEQFNYLMKSQRFQEASKDVAPEIGRADPHSTIHRLTREESSLLSNYSLIRDAFEAREQGFVDVMTAVEIAAVPFPGDPPIVYPPAEVWQALSARRKERYGSINLAGGNDSEGKIYSALKQKIEPDYPGIPMNQIMTTLSDELGIPIWINTTELDLLALSPDQPITLSLPPVSLRSALRLMLEPLELTYIIRNEVLEITSRDSAEDEPINKVYPVGDLVVPPTPMGGGMMGGMGGGMGGMGGGMGGMGGGMGGMGGGMGGMGGGMGGMGGGMGGGMFVVPDDRSKSDASSPLAKSTSEDQLQEFVSALESATEEDRADVDKKVRRWVEYRLEVASANVEAKNSEGAVAEFQKVIDVVGGLLSAGYPQPWMYQALSLSMEACDYPAADIKRVLLSSLDFDGKSSQAIQIARYLASKGMKAEALDLLRDVQIVEPHRYDVFALAMPLASETGDFEALRWVCKGILSKAWPEKRADLYQKADMLARATKIRLEQEGRVVEATAFGEEILEAKQRDIAVRVTWTGDADLDIRVQEPAGTICSLSNPHTMGGGVLLGDASSKNRKQTIDGFSEYYVCSKGFSGQYDVLIRRIFGEVSGGKVTVEIFTDFGRPEQTHIIKQLELDEDGALIQVAAKNGSRTEPIAAAQIAKVQKDQFETGRAILGQFGGGPEEDSSGRDYFNYRNQLAAAAAARQRGFGFPVGGGAVGYRPVITTIPEGINMFTTGVVSADRRYVRISPAPNFTGIGEIFTFNFVSGNTTQQGQGGGQGGQFGGGGAGGAGGGFGF